MYPWYEMNVYVYYNFIEKCSDGFMIKFYLIYFLCYFSLLIKYIYEKYHLLNVSVDVIEQDSHTEKTCFRNSSKHLDNANFNLSDFPSPHPKGISLNYQPLTSFFLFFHWIKSHTWTTCLCNTRCWIIVRIMLNEYTQSQIDYYNVFFTNMAEANEVSVQGWW